MRYRKQGDESCPITGATHLSLFNINPAAPICPQATASYQNEIIQMTGMPHHTKATSGSPVFSIAAAGATSRGGALSVLLMQEEGGTVGFGAGGGLGFVFLWGGSESVPTSSYGI